MATLPASPAAPHVLWRTLGPDDLPEIVALEAQVHAAPWSLGNFRDALAAGYATRCAVREDRVVAYGVLMMAPGEAQILNVSVAPDARREGFGRALVHRFIEDARALGAEQCFLEVRVSNSGAIALYEGMGFMRIARRAAYYPSRVAEGPREDALVMRIELAPPRVPWHVVR